MAKRKQQPKFYVVWKGHSPGVYTSWAQCQQQTNGYPGAIFKSFESRAEAEAAFRDDSREHVGASRPKRRAAGSAASKSSAPANRSPVKQGLAVDAACAGNPGVMEYRGVMIESGEEVFLRGPFEQGTNNIGEFLAIVHGLAYLRQLESPLPIYSDSQTAISWVKHKIANTQLPRTARSERLFRLIDRAEQWLRDNTYDTPIHKWDTKRWGEIPADFGRK
ncbi:MAG: ribonuclease H family protein [Pirellulaceae bacterium]|nr:ribonuclease H family protein [Pirellulaceae bacterium]